MSTRSNRSMMTVATAPMTPKIMKYAEGVIVPQ